MTRVQRRRFGGSRSENPPADRPTQDAAGERGRTVTVAALRAAYAWSVRRERPQAMPEISRMTAVVMAAFGPGRGPTTPRELVAALAGKDLGTLLSGVGEIDAAVAAASLLTADGDLTDAAYDLAAELVVPLGVPSDEADWLPSWTRMRSEEIRRRTFKALVDRGDHDYYVRGRRFLIENPAAESHDDLRDLLAASGISGMTQYRQPREDQVYRVDDGSGWWWPCRRCGWPMGVTGGKAARVRCRYEPHDALYEALAPEKGRRSPRLRPVGETTPTKVPRAREAEGAVCVDAGVWRHIVVPGCTELRLYEQLSQLKRQDGSNVRVDLWPQEGGVMDAFDLHVHVGRGYKVDIKEYRTVWRLVTDLRDKPPRAPVLLPKDNAWQKERVAALSGITIYTEAEFMHTIRKALRAET